MIDLCEFEKLILQDLVYDEKLISIIDDLGRQIYLDRLGDLYKHHGSTIKVEGLEKYNESLFKKCFEIGQKYNHFGPVTCHAFRGFLNSFSFPLHTDPDDVLLYMIYGEKKIIIGDDEMYLKAGDEIFIPANTKHRAIYTGDSLMLSFGLEKFLVNKL
jgi:mannose-6-phosphate isomerase-like protein (cupin superfamily)